MSEQRIILQPSDLSYRTADEIRPFRDAMTVRELMNLLSDYEPDTPVTIQQGCYFQALVSVED